MYLKFKKEVTVVELSPVFYFFLGFFRLVFLILSYIVCTKAFHLFLERLLKSM